MTSELIGKRHSLSRRTWAFGPLPLFATHGSGMRIWRTPQHTRFDSLRCTAPRPANGGSSLTIGPLPRPPTSPRRGPGRPAPGTPPRLNAP